MILAKKRNAKAIKVALEKQNFLDKSYRMSNIDAASFSDFAPIRNSIVLLQADDILISSSEYIAIPIYEECARKISIMDAQAGTGTDASSDEFDSIVIDLVIGLAKQSCPYSTSVLGNANRQVQLSSNNSMNLVQNMLVQTILEYQRDTNEGRTCTTKCTEEEAVKELVAKLSNITTPPKLELMGDDRTLVITFRGLNLATDESFQHLMKDIIKDDDTGATVEEFMTSLWKKLAASHRSHRVVRRGEIDPNSKVRESGHSILWIDPPVEAGLTADYGKN